MVEEVVVLVVIRGPKAGTFPLHGHFRTLATITEAAQNRTVTPSLSLAQAKVVTAQFRRRKGKFVVSILGWV